MVAPNRTGWGTALMFILCWLTCVGSMVGMIASSDSVTRCRFFALFIGAAGAGFGFGAMGTVVTNSPYSWTVTGGSYRSGQWTRAENSGQYWSFTLLLIVVSSAL